METKFVSMERGGRLGMLMPEKYSPPRNQSRPRGVALRRSHGRVEVSLDAHSAWASSEPSSVEGEGRRATGEPFPQPFRPTLELSVADKFLSAAKF